MVTVITAVLAFILGVASEKTRVAVAVEKKKSSAKKSAATPVVAKKAVAKKAVAKKAVAKKK